VADRSTASLDLERTVIRASVNGFVTNLTLVVGQYAAVGTKLMALIDSGSLLRGRLFRGDEAARYQAGEPSRDWRTCGSAPA
jgi:multidrug resistance efflux pump